MSRKKLALIIALVVSGCAGGVVVLAQEAPTPQTQALLSLLEDAADRTSQEPGSRSLSVFFDGGAYLGVGTEDINKENMGRYGMREVRGVGVTEVMKDSPAEKAGLRKDDVIVRFEGESITSVRKLTRMVNESAPDQTVRLTISRGGAEQEVTATLAKHDYSGLLQSRASDDVFRSTLKSFPRIDPGTWPGNLGDGNWVFGFSNRRIGVSTQTLSKQLAEYFGVAEGVLITSVSENSPAAKAGLKAGDVITSIDGEKVSSPGDIARVLSKKETGDVSLTVVRDHNTRTVTVTPEKNPQPNLIRTGTLGTRHVVVPSIQIPAIPQININIPPITVPATPPIDITVPAPAARKSRVVII